MKATIFDMKERFLRTINGDFKNGDFIYREGLPFFGQEMHLVVNLDRCMQIGKDKVAFYKFDGKNYHQIALDINAPSSVNVADYIQNYKLSELQKNGVLKEPFNFKDIMKFLEFVLIMIAIGGIYIVSTNTTNSINANLKPFNQSIAACIQNAHISQNMSLQLYKLFNQSYSFNKAHYATP
jgi:hypothetical protein